MNRVRVRRHVRRRQEPAVERADIPSIEHRLVRRGRVSLGAGEEAMITRGEKLSTLQGIPATEWTEQAWSNIDRLLGWGVVPPTTMRITSDGERVVAAQEFVPAAINFSDIEDEVRAMPGVPFTGRFASEIFERVDRRRMQKIALLDMVLGQADRHSGNIVVDRMGNPWAIDNEVSLLDESIHPDTFGGGAATRWFEDVPIPQDLRADLRRLDRGDFYAALAGIEPHLIDAAWARKQALVRSGVFP